MSENVFCPIPWNFTAVRSNGDFRVCCHANQSESRGLLYDEDGSPLNARDTKIENVRNSPRLKEMRAEMLANKWPKECTRCQSEEVSGLRSRRTYEREAWFIDNDFAKKNTKPDGQISEENFPLHYIDLRFGNKCNLACRMCGPSDSSSWYKDHVGLNGKNFFYDTHGKVELLKNKAGKYTSQDYSWYESDVFWSEMSKYDQGIKHIYMAGGEPLLIDEHYRFLADCIKRGFAKSIILEYNTNLTYLSDETLAMWENFKEVRVGASVDGLDKVFEYQRYPAKWSGVFDNLIKLDASKGNIKCWLAVTITNYNIFHLSDLIKWKVETSGFQKINSSKGKPFITHHMCHSPKHLNVRSLPYDLKQKVIGDFIALNEWASSRLDSDKRDKLKKLLAGIEKYMMSGDYYNKHWNEFITYTKGLDQLRGESVSLVISEFKEYF